MSLFCFFLRVIIIVTIIFTVITIFAVIFNSAAKLGTTGMAVIVLFPNDGAAVTLDDISVMLYFITALPAKQV